MPTQTPVKNSHIRIARPTDNLPSLKQFYIEGLWFDILYEFANHNGFDGLIIGHESAGYHLEFTHAHGHMVGKAPSQDNLLVFYLEDGEEWEAAVERMEAAGFESVASFNPYWDVRGKTFEDPDGYRVVLQNAGWENKKTG